MATGFISTAAPISSTPASLGIIPAPTAVAPATVAPAAAAITPNASVATGYDAGAATGGGAITDFIGSASARLAASAQSAFQRFQKALDTDIATATANGTTVDPAKMQQYQMQMSSYEMIMQLAAKIQEKQDRAAQVWLQL